MIKKCINNIDKAATYLKSEQCTSGAVNNGETVNNDKATKDGEVAKSGVTYITYSNVLFVTLAVLSSLLLSSL